MSTAAQARWQESREGLELLLARADDQRPVLGGGLELESVWNAPKPEALPGRAGIPSLDRRDGDPNDLLAQRWAVVAPLGEEGDAFLRAAEPLVRHRERQQGAPAMRYRVPPDMDAAAAVKWKRQVLRAEHVPEEERPRYLLLLGDLHQVSVELQHVLASDVFVGRLHFARPTRRGRWPSSGTATWPGRSASPTRRICSAAGPRASCRYSGP